MARQLRLEFEGALYHVTSRGNARNVIFVDDFDRKTFLNLLGREVGQQSWLCYAYCLMDNHYHLLIETPEANLSRGMRRLNGVYTQVFNRRHQRVGHAFQGRYKSILVDKESYLLELCRYIVLNPLRAGMVSHERDWPWSSYRFTAGVNSAPDWLCVRRVWELLGDGAQGGRGAYCRFVREGVHQPSPWKDLRGQVFLGRESFLERMERVAQRQRLDNVPLSQSHPTRVGKEHVLEHVSAAYGLSVEQLL